MLSNNYNFKERNREMIDHLKQRDFRDVPTYDDEEEQQNVFERRIKRFIIVCYFIAIIVLISAAYYVGAIQHFITSLIDGRATQ